MMAAAVAIEPEPTPAPHVEPEQWALAYTHPREEFRAKESLENAGFDAYLPTRWEWKRPRFSTKRVLCEVPRYDRYLFVGLEKDMRWRKILVSPGVASLIANSAGVPALLPRRLIDIVRDQCAKDPKPEAKAKRPEFKKDELLAVISGIYSQYRARFDAWEGEQCRVFVTMFGRDTKARINPKDLERL